MATNTGFKGIDVLQTGAEIVTEALLTSSGAALSTGTTNLSILEIQSDATIKSYDFNDNTFKTTACTTFTSAMTERPANNATVHVGLWTHVLTTLTGFTVGGVYLFVITNTTADTPLIIRMRQYGSAEGDLKTIPNGAGVAELGADVEMILGVTSNGQPGYAGIDWGAVFNKAAANSFSATSIALASTAGTVSDLQITSGAVGATPAPTSTTFALATALGADNKCVGCTIKMASAGSGLYESRTIIGYVNSTKVVTVDRPWTVGVTVHASATSDGAGRLARWASTAVTNHL